MIELALVLLSATVDPARDVMGGDRLGAAAVEMARPESPQVPAVKPKRREPPPQPEAEDLPPADMPVRVDPERPPPAKPSTPEESRAGDGPPLAEYEGVAVQCIETRFEDQTLSRRYYVIVKNGKPTAIDHGPDWRWHDNHQIRIKRIWRNGKQNGTYQEWYPSGYPKARGEYVDDQKDGPWSTWYEDGGAQTLRSYKQGQLDGRVIEWFGRGARKLEQLYKQGQLDGVEKGWYGSGGDRIELTWRDGKRNGPSLEWSNKGVLRSSGVYENNLETGLWTRIDETGQKFEEHYKAGQLDGPRTMWSPGGRKVSEGDYAQGKAVGRHTSYFPSGAKLSEVEYKDGVQDGPVRYYFENGKLQIEGEMKAGKKEGLWTYWNPDGTRDPTWSGRYHDDKKVSD